MEKGREDTEVRGIQSLNLASNPYVILLSFSAFLSVSWCSQSNTKLWLRAAMSDTEEITLGLSPSTTNFLCDLGHDT